MKKTAHNGHAETLKETIEEVSQRSKETIRSIIDSSSRRFESALDANNKFMESLEKQIFSKELADGSIASEVKKTFGNTVELSEEAIDTIIDIQSEQLKSEIEFNEKLMERIREIDFSDKEDREELLGVMDDSLKETSQRLIENTKRITDIYNKHINLTVNFNERFSKNINERVQMLNRFQDRNVDVFNEWAQHWLRTTSEVKA